MTPTTLRLRLAGLLSAHAGLNQGDATAATQDVGAVDSYATAAELLFVAPLEPTLGFALDTRQFYRFDGAAWSALGSVVALGVFEAEGPRSSGTFPVAPLRLEGVC